MLTIGVIGLLKTKNPRRVEDDMHEVECPYCGCKNGNLWEWLPNEMEPYNEDYECGGCEKTFKLSRIVTIDYEATPIEGN
jgi:hypothetical protein